MSVDNKNQKPTVLQMFQKMHEETNFGSSAYSLTSPQGSDEMLKDIQQERHSSDAYAGRTWVPALVVNNQESIIENPSIGDQELTGGHKLVYAATGDRTIAVRCLVPGSVLRHPTAIDDTIVRQYPKFTCDLNTLNSIPPVGSILMVMWNNKQIRKGGIILGYAVGGQRQQDDFSIFAAADSCGEVVPTKMKTTHAAGESLPAQNVAKATELKLEKTQVATKDPEDAISVAAPNSTWTTTDQPPSGSAVESKPEVKAKPNTPAEVPKKNEAAPEVSYEIVCNKSYQLSETAEDSNGVSPNEQHTSKKEVPDQYCRVTELSKRVGIPARLLLAFMQVESKGNSRACRFEPHVFRGDIRSRNIDKARPDLKSKIPWTPRNKKPPLSKDKAWYISRIRKETNRAAFNKAYALDPIGAIQSTSFGDYQVMGRSLLREYRKGKVDNPQKAIEEFDKNPQAVSDILLIWWIKGSYWWRKVAKAGAKTGKYDFVRLATYYNGAGQAKKYGKLLKEAYDALEGVDISCGKNIPKENPRDNLAIWGYPHVGPIPIADVGLTLDSWVRGKFKGKVAAMEVIKDGPVSSAQGRKGLLAADLGGPIRRMKEGYKRDVPNGPPLQINSTYRSYEEQLEQRRKLLKPAFLAEYNRRGGRGVKAADDWLASRAPQRKHFRVPVAKPGRSNHNSGTAIDLQTNAGGGQTFKRRGALYSEDQFYDKRKSRKYKGKQAHNWRGTKNDTVQPWKWLAENAHRYGFIRTVYSERWHYVFVGETAGAKRFSKIKKTHGSWDGLAGVVPAKEKARRRRAEQARRRRNRS